MSKQLESIRFLHANRKWVIAIVIASFSYLLTFVTKYPEVYALNLQAVLVLGLVGLISSALISLAIYDWRHYSIPAIATLVITILLAVTNLLAFIIAGNNLQFADFSHQPGSALLAGISAAGFVICLILITRGKGIGTGDIFLAAIMGFCLGLDKILIGFYISIISASAFGMYRALKLRQFKGVRLPLVPFIVAGILITILIAPDLKTLLAQFYP